VPAAIRICYRHRAGCHLGDCPGHVAVIRNPRDAHAVVRRLAAGHPERPVVIERVGEVRE
jgi:hypothetical protein